MKRCLSLLTPLALGVLGGLAGCAPWGETCALFAPSANVTAAPHPRFHPVPTRPVFENRAFPPIAAAEPPAEPLEWPPVVIPEKPDDEPALLPELPPPTSRRLQGDSFFDSY